ncbi:bifunctional folylpolyglutamate synthase/dihydrofolate synthase [Candidatus Micrarchaeota archaeon]|nr:bifunctional folylpolyglutamate synthase/dihydrofolate synthase [Candidatus Micrarchaeota archaeon]
MKELELILEKFGSKPGLERIKHLLSEWVNPQKDFKTILVGGTNGKGSTTAFLSKILEKAGYKTGSYYSPHLKRYNERIRINGREIRDEEFSSYVEKVKKYLGKGNEITLFEALTAIAFQYFSDNGVDFAVVEVGMGGRLDATNVADEILSVIPSVSLEHTRWLGETIPEVAREKAGIIKKGVCITGAEGDALKEIKKHGNVYALGDDFKISNIKGSIHGNSFDYSGKKEIKNLKTKMIGSFQAVNASLAVRASEELGIDEGSIREGIFESKINGRMEIIRRKPLFVIDAAHNPAGIRTLTSNLHLFGNKNIVCLFGVLEDKNWREMVRLLAPKCSTMVITKPNSPRAESPELVADYAKKFTKVVVNDDIKSSLNYIEKVVAKDDHLILATGSIYLIGEVSV